MALFDIPTEAEMLNLGQRWSQQLNPGSVLFFSGELGAGKTTLVRGILNGLGHEGAVTSPTYTLVEPYEFDLFTVFHFDLYRLQSVDELEMIGVRDMFNDRSICLIEWPDRGSGLLPLPDYDISIRYESDGRQVEVIGRHAGMSLR